jgi:tRNA(fMet)-specific endonuclease VapC
MDAALLDTNILSEILKRKNPALVQRSSAYLRQHGRFAFSAMSRFEVVRGLKERAAWAQLARFGLFCRHSSVLPISDLVLDGAGDLWVAARRIGVVPPDADLIIAATALESGLILTTGNTRHFAWISGLRLDDWRTP